MPSKRPAKRLKPSNLEFSVYLESAWTGCTKVYSRMPDALVAATSLSLATGEEVIVDVLTWSRAAAVKYAGDEGGEQYDSDPEASVFERLLISATSLGRIS